MVFITSLLAVIVVMKFYRQDFDDAKQGMIAAYDTGDYTLQAVADTFKAHYRRSAGRSMGNDIVCYIERLDPYTHELGRMR